MVKCIYNLLSYRLHHWVPHTCKGHTLMSSPICIYTVSAVKSIRPLQIQICIIMHRLGHASSSTVGFQWLELSLCLATYTGFRFITLVLSAHNQVLSNYLLSTTSEAESTDLCRLSVRQCDWFGKLRIFCNTVYLSCQSEFHIESLLHGLTNHSTSSSAMY